MKVGVIMGGISSEREISLKSGNSIVEKIDKSKYEVIPVVIDDKEDIITKVKGLDFALLALHGKFGEDGTVQSVLQTLDIPYSGCGPISSGICMDKDFTKRVLKANDIRTARWINVSSVDEIDYDKIEEMGYPVFVKPTNGGSSVATFKVKEKSEIRAAVEEGIVAGGGTALINVAPAVEKTVNELTGGEKLGATIVLKALEEPVKQIARNAGLEPAVIADNVKKSEVGVGFDASKEEYVDMKKSGIVDPTKVTRSALQNAASIASMVITTESLVADIPEKDCHCGHDNGMGAAGMDGMY